MEDKLHLKSETAYFMALQEGKEARVYLKNAHANNRKFEETSEAAKCEPNSLNSCKTN
jgi:hypothetical protein